MKRGSTLNIKNKYTNTCLSHIAFHSTNRHKKKSKKLIVENKI